MISRIGKRNRGQKSGDRGQKNKQSVFCSLFSVLCHLSSGFTLVELLAAVAVIAVGMVFVLGAFSQCVTSLSTAQKLIPANYLLNAKIAEIDLLHTLNNGSEEGDWAGSFAAPYEAYRWTQTVAGVSADFGNITSFVREKLNEERVMISWQQGKTVKDVSVVRYVKRKQEK